MRVYNYLVALFLLLSLTACPIRDFTFECGNNSNEFLMGENIQVFKNGKSVQVDKVRLIDFFTNVEFANANAEINVTFNGMNTDTIYFYAVFNKLKVAYPFSENNAPKSFKLEAIKNNIVVGSTEIQAIKKTNCQVQITKGKGSINID